MFLCIEYSKIPSLLPPYKIWGRSGMVAGGIGIKSRSKRGNNVLGKHRYQFLCRMCADSLCCRSTRLSAGAGHRKTCKLRHYHLRTRNDNKTPVSVTKTSSAAQMPTDHTPGPRARVFISPHFPSFFLHCFCDASHALIRVEIGERFIK